MFTDTCRRMLYTTSTSTRYWTLVWLNLIKVESLNSVENAESERAQW